MVERHAAKSMQRAFFAFLHTECMKTRGVQNAIIVHLGFMNIC